MPADVNKLLLSVIIPAHNEERNLEPTVSAVTPALEEAGIPFEIIVVNDNSTDQTQRVAETLATSRQDVRVVNRYRLGGFGRAVRAGLAESRGDVAVIIMADHSDDPNDVVRYYRKIEEGYDCVFGSRFRPGSTVTNYPFVKLFFNRVVNKMIQMMFWTRFNDLTNAFKAYRRRVITECGPYSASHFNLTIEMSLSALIRGYHIAEVPVNWYGRTWGCSKLRLTEMGRRYLSVLLKIFSEKMLISDDIMAERLIESERHAGSMSQLEERVRALEQDLAALKDQQGRGSSRSDNEPE
ncbi:glycosyltransferase family 2 protein [Planctomycetota bacterium]